VRLTGARASLGLTKISAHSTLKRLHCGGKKIKQDLMLTLPQMVTQQPSKEKEAGPTQRIGGNPIPKGSKKTLGGGTPSAGEGQNRCFASQTNKRHCDLPSLKILVRIAARELASQ
jgi:hypothetical protein